MANALSPIYPDGGIDRHQIRQLLSRVERYHDARLARALDDLEPDQRHWVQSLPLLFHRNHPGLACYAGAHCPAGIVGYRPDEAALTAAKRIAANFRFRQSDLVKPCIKGIYLIGSYGSIAYNSHSDLDIWVCVDSGMGDKAIAALKQKCAAICRWGKQLALDTHCFVMDDNDFRRQQRDAMDSDSCGQTQHVMLLDEFYRSGVKLAGLPLLWWCLPPKQSDPHLADKLLSQHFLPSRSALHFGNSDLIPAEECLSAAVWQLYKSINSPHKSLLKLMLLETYAAQYPIGSTLSCDVKQALYDDELDNLDTIDPYVMMYKKVERYLLERKETQRLKLLQRSFYHKSGVYISRLYRNKPNNGDWRAQRMLELLRDWGWTQSILDQANALRTPSIADLKRESVQLTQELLRSYHTLAEFAQRHMAHTKNNDELIVLGRYLQAALKKAPGKITRVNQALLKRHQPRHITLRYLPPAEEQTRGQWSAEAGSTIDSQRDMLFQHPSISKVLAWCIANKALAPQTTVHIDADSRAINDFDIQKMRRRISALLQSIIALNNENDTRDIFSPLREDALVTDISVFINANGVNNNTPLHDLQLLQVSSWGEVYVQTFDGPEALNQCIRHVLEISSQQSVPMPSIDVGCANCNGSARIAQGIEKTLNDLVSAFQQSQTPTAINPSLVSAEAKPAANPRQGYIFEADGLLRLVVWDTDQHWVEWHNDREQLLAAIAAMRHRIQHIHIDSQLAMQANWPINGR